MHLRHLIRTTVTLTSALLAACGAEVSNPSTDATPRALELGALEQLPAGRASQARIVANPAAMATLVAPIKLPLIPQPRFCEAVAAAMCAPVDACGCGEAAVDCAARVEAECLGPHGVLNPSVRSAISAGELEYDPTAAFQLVARLEAGSAACLQPIEALQWARADLVDFAGVLRGKVALGDSCAMPFSPFQANVCAEGLCLTGKNGNSSCVPVADIGETCDAQTVCMERERRVTTRDLAQGALFARCVDFGGGEQVCQPLVADGGKCFDDRECSSQRCDEFLCQPLALVGQSCSSDFDCADGACDDGACAMHALPVGAQCERDAHCDSGACNDARCVQPICG